MSAKKHFKKHYSRLLLNAVITSALLGLIPGAFSAFICALVTWLIGSSIGLWLSLATLAVVTAASALVIYFKYQRPSALSGARSIDRLGLEERAVTMIEYESDDSVIARLQREDAKRQLEAVSAKNLKIRLSRVSLILIIIASALSVVMLTVSLFTLLGLIPSGRDLINDAVEEAGEIRYLVTYDAEDGGYIEGVTEQAVISGKNASSVVAVANDGYIFIAWDDGTAEAGRMDKNITADVVYIAIFEPIDEESEDSADTGEENEGPPDKIDPDADKTSEEPGEPGDTPSSTGGKYEEANQVIDGNTYYLEKLEEYKNRLLERHERDADKLTDEERAIIEAYLGIL